MKNIYKNKTNLYTVYCIVLKRHVMARWQACMQTIKILGPHVYYIYTLQVYTCKKLWLRIVEYLNAIYIWVITESPHLLVYAIIIFSTLYNIFLYDKSKYV